MPLRGLARPPRRRRPARRDARSAARPPVPAVRAAVVQHPQAGVRQRVGDGSAVGSPQLAGPVLPGATHRRYRPSVRNWFGVAVGIAALAAMSGRTETKRLHAWLFVALGRRRPAQDLRVQGASTGSAGCRFSSRSSSRRSRRPSPRSRLRCWRGSAFRWCGAATSGLRRFLMLLAAAIGAAARLRAHGRPLERDHERRPATTFAVVGPGLRLRRARGRRRAPRRFARSTVRPHSSSRLWSSPSSSCSRRSLSTRSGPIRFSRPAGCPRPGRARGRAAFAGVRARRQAVPEHRGRARTAGHPRARRAVRRAVHALRQDVHRTDAYSIGSPATELPVMFRDNPMFDALSVAGRPLAAGSGDGAGAPVDRPDRDTRVYENTNAYPRAWVVHDVHVVGERGRGVPLSRGDEPIARTARSSSKRSTLGARPSSSADGKTADETLDAPRRAGRSARQRARDEASIEHYSGESVTLRVEAACPGLLVLPDIYFPGWRATVNGRESTIYPTDGAFRGVAVPKEPRVSSSATSREPSRRNWARPCRACPAAFSVVALVAWWRRRPRGMESPHDTRRGRIAVPVVQLPRTDEHLADVDSDLPVPQLPTAECAWRDRDSAPASGWSAATARRGSRAVSTLRGSSRSTSGS